MCLALVAGTAGLMAAAQNQIAPVAVAVIGDPTVDGQTGIATVELDGTGSFDPDPGGSIVSYRWEVVTEAYQWVAIEDGDTATASFEVPSLDLTARYGPSIEFRLTVTDSGSPAATATAVAAFSVNRRPVADITVTAKRPAARFEEHEGHDDDGDGEVDENDERYTREGVIHGPGEGGNQDFEWDIREGSLLVVDGSGSSDPDGPLPPSAFSWVRLFASDVPAITTNLPGDTTGQKILSTDEDPQTVGTTSSETVGSLPYMQGRDADPYYLYYMLTVTDEGGASSSAVVKIVIRDSHDHPAVEISHPESNPDASTAVQRREGVLEAGENRYVISTEVAEEGVTLTAEGEGDGAVRTRELIHTWSGTGVEPSGSNQAGATSTAVFTAPQGTAEGDSFAVGVQVEDPSGLVDSTTVELVVADTRAPTATAPPEIETNDGTDGGYPESDPPTGIVRLRGIGFDPDGDEVAFRWEQVLTAAGAPLTETFRGPRLVLNQSATPETWFVLPEVTQGTEYVVYVQLTVTDSWGVADTDIVTITILDGVDDIKAISGPPERVAPGSFVRLYGSLSSGMVSADAAASITHTWAYIGIETHPRIEHRPPITDAEKAQGFVFGEWFPHDGLDENGNPDPAEAAGTYSLDAGGRVNVAISRYPYFDAPELGGFNSVKLIFELTVSDIASGRTDSDTVSVLVLGPFFSGVVNGPDYCANLSLGGPETYPFDRDSDGVADTCSLQSTRRAAVARQNALETLASLNPDLLATALHGIPDDPGTPDIDESTVGTCVSAPDDLGDAEDDLAEDVCGRARQGEEPEKDPSPLPPVVDPQQAAQFFSSVIDGPNFCTNMSLGSPRTFAYDSDGNGVADTCSLPFTRREAIARQNALEEAFSGHSQYEAALAAACAALGTLDFGDPPDDLAQDLCSAPPAEEEDKGRPLPTPSG